MSTNIPPELDRLIREAVQRDATDLFLIPGEPPTFRVGGLVERIETDPLSAVEVTEIAVAVIGQESLAQVGTETGAIRKSCHLDGEITASVSVARAYGDYTVSVALSGLLIFSVDDLKLPAAMVDAVLAPNGLIVVCGAVGSGFYTSTYALMDHRNSHRADHICTVENPILARLTAKKSIVQQREIGVDVPDGLAGIQAGLKQDLDMLYVSEIRSVEELQGCITAAATGHLVLTVLNLNISPEAAVERLIEIFPEDIREVSRKDLAKVLRGVSTQQLLPKIDGGRDAAIAVLVPDTEMRSAIAEGRDFMDRKGPMPEGCQSMADDITRLRDEGIISGETAGSALMEFQV